MTVQEFYSAIGGNYEEAQGRLMNDTLIKKFVIKFKDDQNFLLLKGAIEKSDFENAFVYSHTLKGVALNLAFAGLSQSAVELTDALREPVRQSLTQERADELFSAIEKNYNQVIENIDNL